MTVPSVSPVEAVIGSYTLVDVRSPQEFAQGHVPGAVNRPLLGDRQRAAVGTAYAEQGGAEARLLAMDLVAPDLPPYLRSLAALARTDRRLAVMCWRGGERSRNVVLLLALVGVHAVQVTGGYKAYRRWVLDGLRDWAPDRPTFTVYGYTGSGKTLLLHALADMAPSLSPRPTVVDLEGLALHRGSLLGGLNQPGKRTQKDFDALLWDALRNARGEYFVFEGEGTRIGDIYLPESVGRTLREGRPVLLDDDAGGRAERLMTDYAPDSWDAEDRAQFERSLDLIGERMPAGQAASLKAAFRGGRFREVVRSLLVGYYDPLYQRSSVDGRPFVFVLRAGPSPREDARAFAAEVARLLPWPDRAPYSERPHCV